LTLPDWHEVQGQLLPGQSTWPENSN